jgi:hypothetical protein
MKIYEIDQEISRLMEQTDPETGEVLFDVEALEALQMERDTKVENLALAVKNMKAEIEAFKTEETALEDRRKAVEGQCERAKKYLEYVLGGEKFKSVRVSVSYTTSPKVETDEAFVAWAKTHADFLLRYKEPEPDKKAIKELLNQGGEAAVEGHAKIVKSTSMVIK